MSEFSGRSSYCRIEGPLIDRWGAGVSGLAPISDPSNNRGIAVLGPDVNATRWRITVGEEVPRLRHRDHEHDPAWQEKSDLFDVLGYVAYALPPVTREERAAKAKMVISLHFNSKQRVFLDFVLSHYVRVGVEELDQEKLRPLPRLMYRDSIADAVADLGRAESIGRVFVDFQKYLYLEEAVA